MDDVDDDTAKIQILEEDEQSTPPRAKQDKSKTKKMIMLAAVTPRKKGKQCYLQSGIEKQQ